MSSGPHGEPSKGSLSPADGDMPDDRAAVTTRVVLRSKKAVGVSLRHGGVPGDAFAPLSPPILFSVGKSCGGLLGDHEEHAANDLTCLCPLSRVGYRAFSCRPRQQVYRPNRSNMPQPSSHG